MYTPAWSRIRAWKRTPTCGVAWSRQAMRACCTTRCHVIAPGQTAEGEPRSKLQLEAAIRERQGVGIGGRFDCFGGASLPGLSIEMLDGWAPGSVPAISPLGSGQRLVKDSLILIDLHYHPTGESETDSETQLALMLADERPELISQTVLLGNVEGHQDTPYGVGELLQQPDEDQPEFTIPAGVSDHVEEMTWTWKLAAPVKVYASATHMHYVGRDMRVTLEHAQAAAEDRDECLIETPRWDFNWQRGYGYAAEYAALPSMADGDVLHMRCVYDNTLQNRFVAKALRDRGFDAPVDVKLGEDTLDEMCVAGLAVLYPNPNPP
jgi:hypothetical protein